MNPHDGRSLPEQDTGKDSNAGPTHTPSPTPGSSQLATTPPSLPFSVPATASTALLPPKERCHTHLKLLGSFHKLYVQISGSSGLFGYSDDLAGENGKDKETTTDWQRKRREKRWEVYVTRAVARFTAWWRSLPRTGHGSPVDISSMENYVERVLAAGMEGELDGGLVISADTMPPLDVLMVWHAYMLSPRCFLEDCFRLGLMDFWMTGLPWVLIDSLIDEDFNYNLSPSAIHHFSEKTSLPGDNLSMADTTTVTCPSCNTPTTVLWTDPQANTGFADSNFLKICATGQCRASITVDTLSRGKFLSAVRDLADAQKRYLLPGTILDEDGKIDVKRLDPKNSETMFPNHLCNFLSNYFLDISTSPTAGMDDIKSIIESRRKKIRIFSSKKKYLFSIRTGYILLRRMMSRFWNNPSPFALDLVGAVIRQGSFTEKMASIDWYHSPSVAATMERAGGKYLRFWGVIAKYPSQVVVPTLNIDLIWHTHMLVPKEYWKWSVGFTGRFIAHDDKLEETKIGTGFRWTCEKWRKMYKEDYTECNCWFCEANRVQPAQPALTLERFFRSTKSAPGPPAPTSIPTDHLSAHSAVKAQGKEALSYRAVYHKWILASHAKARKKKKKKGTYDEEGGSPLAGFPSRGKGMDLDILFQDVFPGVCELSNFAVDPGWFPVESGAAGNCVAGTCGGGVAAGSCGAAQSGAAECAGGGQAGGCASGGSGGCGGGGCGG